MPGLTCFVNKITRTRAAAKSTNKRKRSSAPNWNRASSKMSSSTQSPDRPVRTETPTEKEPLLVGEEQGGRIYTPDSHKSQNPYQRRSTEGITMSDSTEKGVAMELGSERGEAQPKGDNKQSVTGRLILTIVGATMGSLQFGYNVGVINAPEKFVREFINSTYFSRSGDSLSGSALTNLWALTVAIFSVGGCIGGFSAGFVATRCGRKGGCLLNTIIGVVAAVLMFASRRAGSYEMVIIGRFLVGVHCGVYTGLVPLYLSEVSTSATRGAIGVVHQLAVVSGILFAQIFGFPVILGTATGWDFLLGLAIIPCIVQAAILPFCPESPRYLYISKDDEASSRDSLMKLRDSFDIEEEINEIKREKAICEEQMSILEFLRLPSTRQPLIIGVMMHLSQQFSGINGVFFYSTSLFEGAGLDSQTAAYTSSAVGATMVVMTLITVPLMDRTGRRTLHLLGLAGMTVLSVGITITLALRDDVSWFVEASIVLTLLYVMFFAMGPGSIPWLIVSELFSHDARPAALSICTLVNWVASFAVGYGFALLQSAMGDFVFLPFSVLLVLFTVFTYFKVPETKGKTIEEITALWRT